MIKMTVACMTGLSAEMFAHKLQEKADAKDINVIFSGCALSQIDSKAAFMDVLILGPQIGYDVEKIKESVKNKCAVVTLEVNEFNINECEKIINKAIRTFKG